MKKIDSMCGVLVVVDLLMRLTMWGVVGLLLLRKEMAESDGWDGRSWDFHGWLLISSRSRSGLRRFRLCLLLEFSDRGGCSGGDAGGLLGRLGCWLTIGALDWDGWGRSIVTVHDINSDWVVFGTCKRQDPGFAITYVRIIPM